METSSKPYAVSKNPDHTRYYMGGCWTFLCTGKNSNGKLAVIEAKLRKGLEPPRHTHTKEDETYYLLEGEMEFVVGDHIFHLYEGDFIFLPKDIPHHFKLLSDQARILFTLAPAGLEEMFWQLSKPASNTELPPIPSAPPDPQFLATLKELQQKHGIKGIDNSKIKSA